MCASENHTMNNLGKEKTAKTIVSISVCGYTPVCQWQHLWSVWKWTEV